MEWPLYIATLEVTGNVKCQDAQNVFMGNF